MTKFLKNADVTGYISQTSVTSSLLKTDANGKLVAATAGTDYQAPTTALLPAGGTAGQILSKINATDYNTQWIDNFAAQLKHEVKLGATLSKGAAVYVSSANGTNMIVSAASNASEATSSKTLGLLETGGVTNDLVKVITEGLLAGLDTSTATAGDPVWLGVNGALIFGLANKPVAPAHMVFIGIVTRVQSVNGEIFVKVQNGFELDELHNVSISSLANNHTLVWESATSLWKNKTIAAALGYTPADDSAVVKLTGDQTVAGVKTFTSVVNAPTLSLNGGVLSGNNIVSMRSNPTGGQFRIEKSDGSLSAYPFYIGADGTALAYYYNAAGALKVLLHTDNTSYFGNSLSVGYSTYATTSYMLDVNGTARFTGTLTISTSSSPGLNISKDSSADNRYLRLTNTQASSKSWDLINQTNANSNKFVIYNATDNLVAFEATPAGAVTLPNGSITATSIIKSGGTSTQFLKADGSVDSSTYITSSALSSYLPLAGGTLTGQLSILYSGAIINLRTNSSGNNANLQFGNDSVSNGAGMALFGSAYVSNAQYRQAGAYIYSNQGGGLTLHAEGNTSMYLATNSVAAITINGSQAISLSGALSGTSATFTGNLTVSSGNTTGNGIILADDGDIVDLNDAYCSMRFSYGVRVYSANRGGTPVITLANTGAITATGNISAANFSGSSSGTNTGDQTDISGASTRISSRDNRTIAPNEDSAAQLRFGFTSYNNNDASPWADYLHLRSYSDGTGGADNLVMFSKTGGIGMRIWQQTFGSSSAYSTYADVLLTNNYSNYALPLTGGTLSGALNSGSDVRFLNSAAFGLTWSGTYGGSAASRIFDNSQLYIWTDDQTNFATVSTGASAEWYWRTGVSNVGVGGNIVMSLISNNLTVQGTISASNLSGTNTGDQNLSNYITLDGTQTITGLKTINNNLYFGDSGTTKRGIQGTVGANDFWFVGGGATASNSGFLEIATGDDAQTAGTSEPIYASQYGPGDVLTGTLYRRAKLLDENGNTSFPGALSITSNITSGGYVWATKVGGTGATPAFQVRAAGGGPRIQTYGLDADSNAWMGLGTDMAGNPYEHSLYFPYGSGGYAGLGRQTIGSYNGSSYSMTATFLASGRIGFGIASPEAALHVAQPGQDDQLILGSAANNRDHAMFMYSGSNKAEVMRYQSGTRFILGGSGNISKTSIYGGGSERLTVESSGVTAYRITSTSGGGYNIVGGAALILGGSGATFDNSTGVRLTESYGPVWNCADGATWHHQVINGSSLVGISAAGTNFGNGRIYASGDITAYYSDMRLKTKISNIENALDKVLKLNGFYYTNNDVAKQHGYDDDKVQVGVSAQEVEAILPEIVCLAPFDITGNDKGDMLSKSGENYKTVKYDKLVPLLIEAIKELKFELDELNNKK